VGGAAKGLSRSVSRAESQRACSLPTTTGVCSAPVRRLLWCLDDLTAYWADRCPLALGATSSPQFDGLGLRRPLQASTWRKRICAVSFPAFLVEKTSGRLLCTPDNIISLCRSGAYLEALVLTIGWGSMVRTSNRHIYKCGLKRIERALRDAVASIDRTRCVHGAWASLTGDLGWSDVITSKFLHFAARSSGFVADPPVPIDNRVCLGKAWPAFKGSAAALRAQSALHQPPLPHRWRDKGYGWSGYTRYMTAIRKWAVAKGWTTTQVETTLYDVYKKK
jgi:hypothetical protein